MKSKFEVKDNRTFKQRLEDLKYTILFWKGRKMKYITTRNIQWSDLRYIFFPTEEDKYGYLNATFYKDSEFNKVLRPLVLAMDYEAKPKWCDYDLRISISGPDHLQNLADWIEQGYYNEGYRAKLMRDIAMYEPDPDAEIIFSDIKHLEEQLEKLQNKEEDETFNTKEK